MKVWINKHLVSVFLLTVVSLILADLSPAKDKGDTHPKSIKERKPWLMLGLSPEGCSRGCRNVFNVIKELSGNPNGIILHFSRVTYELVAEMRPEFIILSPQGTPWCRYTGETGIALQNFLWTLPLIAEELDIPILGICGGHQALALAFGGKVGPIRASEDDCLPYTRDRQSGIVPLTPVVSDPIFNGVNGQIRILESHYDEVKVLPPGFILLASDKISPNQIIRHPTKPVYGIQGHPERSCAGNLEAGILIRNFLKIALAYNKTSKVDILTDQAQMISRNDQKPETPKAPVDMSTTAGIN